MVKRKTHLEFIKEVHELTKDEYRVLGTYHKNNTKLEILHNDPFCMKTWWINPNNFLRGTRCPHCHLKNEKTIEAYNHRLRYETRGEYTARGEYQHERSILLFTHTTCNHSFPLRPRRFTEGSRCPKCHPHAVSIGEQRIQEILTKERIPYLAQYRFEDCRYSYPLPFDFAIVNDKQEVLCLIEFQGMQHFEAVDFFGGEKGFIGRQTRDRIKQEYAAAHGIPLVTLTYHLLPVLDSIMENMCQTYFSSLLEKSSHIL